MDNLMEILKANDSADLRFDCHDCGKPVRVTAEKDGTGVIFRPQDGARGCSPEISTGENVYFVKCAECYEKDPVIRNYNPTEVYTRVVGYYRPVSAFNEGKKAEYADRKVFNLPCVRESIETISNIPSSERG
jgi:hypothetical protein